MSIFVGQESRCGLAGHLWYNVSDEVAFRLLAVTVVSSEDSTGGGGSCFQAHKGMNTRRQRSLEAISHLCVSEPSSLECQDQPSSVVDMRYTSQIPFQRWICCLNCCRGGCQQIVSTFQLLQGASVTEIPSPKCMSFPEWSIPNEWLWHGQSGMDILA